MTGHPAAVFLTAALARAEETAKAATASPWKAHRYAGPCDDFEASIGHLFEADVIGHGHEGGGVVEWADAVYIEAFSPDVVLRLVAGARQILAEHGLIKTTGYDAYGAAVFDACRICGRNGYSPGPCRTVLLLAQAWGWTEET